MKRRKIILITALIGAIVSSNAFTAETNECFHESGFLINRTAKTSGGNRASITDTGTSSAAGNINVKLAINTDGVRIRKNEKLVIQPVLLEKQDTVFLPAVTVYGKIRRKYDERMSALYGSSRPGAADYMTIPADGQPDDILYDISIPCDPSLYGSSLAVVQNVYGCGGSRTRLGTYVLGTIVPAMPPLIVFIVPTFEIHEDTLRANIKFPFDRSELNRDYMDNARELARIDSMTAAAVHGNSIQKILLIGYASPEGSWNYNDGLSKRRIRTIKDYVENNYGMKGLIEASNIPEDWEGLRAWLEKSDLRHKDEVIEIIDGISDPDKRDAAIRNIDGGVTYKTLLRKVYPSLRHVCYRINYETSPRTVEKIREIFSKNPEELTLNELYMLAESCPRGSEEYANAWYTVCRLYPENQTALHNAAAASIAKGDFEKAEQYMKRQKECPEKLNNMGAISFYNGDYSTAESRFTESAGAGCKEAASNLKNLYFK